MNRLFEKGIFLGRSISSNFWNNSSTLNRQAGAKLAYLVIRYAALFVCRAE